MTNNNSNVQKVLLDELVEDTYNEGKRDTRLKLRDAFKFRQSPPPSTPAEEECELKRVTAYCTAEAYNLKSLHKILKENNSVVKIQMYFAECLYINYKIEENRNVDIYFLHYGVTVIWALTENEEQSILRLILRVQENPYDLKAMEIENFMYGISKTAQIVDDKIYLNEENEHIKMVLSIGMAQSVKLDYFEEFVDATIEDVKDLPDEVEKDGKVNRRRQDIMKVMGKLQKLSLNLNLVSNILGEPAFVWEFSEFSSLYETCVRYLDIKTRAELLNKRCDIIHGILEILSDNITTQNSEKLEKNMARFSMISTFLGGFQCILLICILGLACYVYKSKSN